MSQYVHRKPPLLPVSLLTDIALLTDTRYTFNDAITDISLGDVTFSESGFEASFLASGGQAARVHLIPNAKIDGRSVYFELDVEQFTINAASSASLEIRFNDEDLFSVGSFTFLPLSGAWAFEVGGSVQSSGTFAVLTDGTTYGFAVEEIDLGGGSYRQTLRFFIDNVEQSPSPIYDVTVSGQASFLATFANSGVLADSTADLALRFGNNGPFVYPRPAGYLPYGGATEPFFYDGEVAPEPPPPPPANLDCPVLVSPDEGSLEFSSPVQFTWEAVAGADSYNFYIGHDPGGGIVYEAPINTTDTTLQVFSIPGTPAFWYVTAVQGASESAGCAAGARSFDFLGGG